MKIVKDSEKQSSHTLLYVTARTIPPQRPSPRVEHKSEQAVETIAFQILFSSVNTALQQEKMSTSSVTALSISKENTHSCPLEMPTSFPWYTYIY